MIMTTDHKKPLRKVYKENLKNMDEYSYNSLWFTQVLIIHFNKTDVQKSAIVKFAFNKFYLNIEEIKYYLL